MLLAPERLAPLSSCPSCAFVAQEEEKAAFNDEAEVAAARKRQELAAQQERLREAYNELKYTAPDKVAAMRDPGDDAAADEPGLQDR